MNSAGASTRYNGFNQFVRELVEHWRALPDRGLFLSLFVAWVALFHFFGNSTLGYVKTTSLFGWLEFIYDTSADESHGKLVPFLVLALFWWKRKEFRAVPKTPWWPAVGLVATGLALHVVGFVIQQTRVSVIGFFLGLYGLTGAVWGRNWLRASFFPFFLFAFCVPLATAFEPISFHMRLWVAQIVAVIGRLLGIDVIREGTQLFNEQHTFGYDVAPACSGIRSLISLLALTTVYGFVTFRSWWRRLVMVLLAVPLAVLGNVVRISFVVVVAEALGQEAGAWIEQKLGFVTFAVAIVCVVMVGRWLRKSEKAPQLTAVEIER